LENNEVSIHNQIGLERWLAKGAKTWARLFSKNHVGSLVDSSDENDDNTNFTTHSTPEREEDNLGDAPEVMATGSTPTTQWIPSFPPPKALLAPQLVDQWIVDLEKMLRLKRKTGYGYIDIKMNYTLCTRLEMILQLLCIYWFNGYKAWVASSAQAATISGHNSPWMARRLREWTHSFVDDMQKLPNGQYGKFSSLVLEDEDLSQESAYIFNPKDLLPVQGMLCCSWTHLR